MSESEVMLFGSFTENEARSWLNIVKKPEERKELQVKSVNPETGLVFGSFDNLNELVGYSDKTPPSNSFAIQKDNKVGNGVSSHGVAPSDSSVIQKDNNKVGNGVSSNGISSNGVAPSYSFVIQKDNKVGNGVSSNGISSDGVASTRIIRSNGSSSNSLPEIHKKEANLKKNGPVVLIRDILPRGLINSGNSCFLNATLQALLYCYPFLQLLQGLRNRKISKVDYPTLASFVEFIGEFDVPEGVDAQKQDVNSLEAGRPFSPTMFQVVLRKFTPNISSKLANRPRQEDAQEFLSFIMDQMHNELLKLNDPQSDMNGNSPSLVSTSDEEGWETIGRKNKSAVTRTQDFVPSELSSIFSGQISSLVKAKGITDSATVQPFLLLHLELWHESVHSIEDALRLFCSSETLDEYRASTTGKGGVVAASKSIKIKSLPKIMILHLMRFSYGRNGSTKLLKPVSFPTEMVLNHDLLASSASEGRRYQLVSTVTHHGREASKGHYTADVRYTNGQWLHFNDASVTTITKRQVLHGQAYLLFYRQL